MSCTCHSYNKQTGTTPEVKMKHLVSVTPDGEPSYKDVVIDACIAPVIKVLWESGVNTLGSCCGHNKNNPSIVLGECEERYSEIRKFIKEVDDRYFELSQWKRVLV